MAQHARQHLGNKSKAKVGILSRMTWNPLEIYALPFKKKTQGVKMGASYLTISGEIFYQKPADDTTWKLLSHPDKALDRLEEIISAFFCLWQYILYGGKCCQSVFIQMSHLGFFIQNAYREKLRRNKQANRSTPHSCPSQVKYIWDTIISQ